jgi:hypothetical protein
MRLTGAIKVSVLALCCAVYSTSAYAQATTKSQSDPRPSAHAAKRTGDISIDGKIDEAAWAAATPIGELTQAVPNEGKAPSEKTEIRILYDDAAIYIGARMFDSMGAKGVKAVLTRRDALLNGGNLTSDEIAFVFDTFRDKRNAYAFMINPGAAQRDVQAFENGRRNDSNWDGVWNVRTQIRSDGWSLECPFGAVPVQARS